ncbi:MAG: TRAP transporter substrate-binding protein DctP [Nocardioides sp.]
MRLPKGRGRPLVGLTVLISLLAACGSTDLGGGDKAGTRSPVVLTVATSGYAPGDTLAHFMEAVERLSGGDIRFDVVSAFGSYAADSEVQMVRAIAAGELDLGSVGSRTFDLLGVTSLEALSAPLLIDSYALEKAVLASPVADQLLGGLDEVGVTGIAMSPSYFQVPIARDHALVDPRAWQGVSLGTYPSVIQEEAIRALGARPVGVIGTFREHALDTDEIQAFNVGLPFYGGDDLPTKARYVAVNVRLWAQIDVIAGNSTVIDDLSPQQRGWLGQAATDTEAYAARVLVDEPEGIQAACQQGARMVKASPEQLAALRSAFDPLYAELRSDPETSAALDEIQDLASSTTPEAAPHVPSTCLARP